MHMELKSKELPKYWMDINQDLKELLNKRDIQDVHVTVESMQSAYAVSPLLSTVLETFTVQPAASKDSRRPFEQQ
jgi:predicted alternative tryptophan synthase beta-subunit